MVKVEQTEQLQAYLTLYYPLSSPTQSLMACKLLGNAVPFTMQFVAAKAVGKQVADPMLETCICSCRIWHSLFDCE